jgi:hypothetical protein
MGYRQLFADYFRAFGEFSFPEEQLQQLTPDKRTKFERVRESRLFSQQFSDTFVFYSQITNRHGDISGPTFFQMLSACAMAVLCGLAAGSPMRGAITVGMGMELEPANFYGPALATSHYLENEVAKYPRVVLSDEAVQFANLRSGFSPDPEIEDVSRRYHPTLSKLLTVDYDGQTVVDYVGEEMRIVTANIPDYASLVADAYRFAIGERDRFGESNDSVLADRYEQVIRYLEARLPLWGLTPERR